MSELHFVITAHSPLALNARKPGGSQYQEAVSHIPGRVIRGVLAATLLRTCKDKLGEKQHVDCPNPQLCRALLHDELLFRDALPVEDSDQTAWLLPATAVSCKNHSGFIADSSRHRETHGVFDTLIDRACWEEIRASALQYQPLCPACGERTHSIGGAYSTQRKTDETISYSQQRLSKELLTRVAINRRRSVAEDTLLYAVSTLSPYRVAKNKDKESDLTVRFPSVQFAGSIYLPDETVQKPLQKLLEDVRHMGSSRSRGLGKVSVKVVSPSRLTDVAQRLQTFNEQFAKRWREFAGLAGIAPATTESAPTATYFSVLLRSDAILHSEDGWEPSPLLTPNLLWHACAERDTPPADLQVVRNYVTTGVAGGWNEIWGMRKPMAQTALAGSVYLFRVANPAGWVERLQWLEVNGVGSRRAEGFGQVRICDEFHTVTGGQRV